MSNEITALNNIADGQMNLDNIIRNLDDCWNTFQYVANSFDN